jgi:hypothetical protein
VLQADDGVAVFKWEDEAGQIHYGDRPAGPAAKKIYIRAPDSPDPAYQLQLERQFRLLHIYTDERIEQQQLEQEQTKNRAARRENCNLAQRSLESIRTARFLYESTGDPFNPRVLSNEERAQATTRAESAVQTWCR